MKIAPFVAGIFLSIGAFSIVDAAIIYTQPSGTYIATSTAVSTLSSTQTKTSDFVVNTAVSVTGGTMYFTVSLPTGVTAIACLYNVTDNNQQGCTSSFVGNGSMQTYTRTYSSGSIVVGKTYRGVITTQSAGPHNTSFLVDSLGSMYFTITDADGGVLGPNWGALSIVPPLDFGAIQYVSTSTSFFSGDASGTLQAIANQCSETGNVFSHGICRAFAYLFVPNPMVINQFLGLGSTTMSKFPFTYVTGIGELIDATQASTTQNMILLAFDFTNVDPATSTPFGHILPDSSTLFGSSTILAYLEGETWTFIQTMMIVAMWLSFAFLVWRELYTMLGGWRRYAGD